MRKAELIDRIVKGAGLSRKKAALALDALLVAVRGSLAGNEALRIPGLGTFKVAQRELGRVLTREPAGRCRFRLHVCRSLLLRRR